MDFKRVSQLRLHVLQGLLVLSTVIGPAITTCYYPDGSAAESGYLPCNNNSEFVSMCCYSPNHDVCTPQGLCLYSGIEIRDTCTDPTWQSLGCVKLCLWVANGTPGLLKCDDGSYCCGNSNSSCCQSGQGVFLRDTTAVLATTLTSLHSSSSFSTTTVSSVIASSTPATPTSSPTSSNSGIPAQPSNSLAIGLGAGLGGAALFISLIAVTLVYLRARQNRQPKTQSRAAFEQPYSQPPLEAMGREVKQSQIHELTGEQQILRY